MTARNWQLFHMGAIIFWILLLIPAWLWWKESIYFVIAVSLYANAATHWSAWQAVRAERVAGGE